MPLTKILYAEDYKLVAHYMKEILEMEGWQVDACTDGLAALHKIESDTAYDCSYSMTKCRNDRH